jgi:hypothetical protein
MFSVGSAIAVAIVERSGGLGSSIDNRIGLHPAALARTAIRAIFTASNSGLGSWSSGGSTGSKQDGEK